MDPQTSKECDEARKKEEKRLAGLEIAANSRERKNFQTRSRSEQQREQLALIKAKPAEFRTTEEIAKLKYHQERKLLKNNRSKELLRKKKEELNRILNISSRQRTASDHKFLEVQLYRKLRKNDGDKLRRLKTKQGGDPQNEVTLPPIPRVGDLQLHLGTSFDFANPELFAPLGYGEDTGADATITSTDFHFQGLVGEKVESSVDKKLGEDQLSQPTAECKLPSPSSLILQRTASLTPLPSAPSSLRPPYAASRILALPLIRPHNPSSYCQQQYNLLSPLPGCPPVVGAAITIPHHRPSSLLAPSVLYRPPSPRLLDYFHPGDLPPCWTFPPPASNLATVSMTFSTTSGGDGGGQHHTMHQHVSLANQAGVVASMAARQHQEQQHARLASAFVAPKMKEQQQASRVSQAAIAVETTTTTTTEDERFFFADPPARKTNKDFLLERVAMTTPREHSGAGHAHDRA